MLKAETAAEAKIVVLRPLLSREFNFFAVTMQRYGVSEVYREQNGKTMSVFDDISRLYIRSLFFHPVLLMF